MFDEGEDAIQVDGDSISPLLRRHFVDGDIFGGPDAVVGYEDVQTTEAGYRGCNQWFGSVCSSEITLHSNTGVLAAFGG